MRPPSSRLREVAFRCESVVFSELAGSQFRSVTFASEKDLEDYVIKKEYDSSSRPGVCAGLVITGSAGSYNVKIRMDDNNYVGGSSDTNKQLVPTPRLPAVDTIPR